jgi:hypothetical protein
LKVCDAVVRIVTKVVVVIAVTKESVDSKMKDVGAVAKKKARSK